MSSRLDSAKDFTEWLTRVEAELTTPEEDVVQNPTEARSGDRLRHGFTVKARLGRGSTAVALLVERDGATQVLKVASDPANNDRLRGEAEILRKLRHQYIVRLDDELDFDGRVGLLMERAGLQTLAQRLRQEGPLHLELLQRFGDDLLTTVDWLEQQGIRIGTSSQRTLALRRSDEVINYIWCCLISRCRGRPPRPSRQERFPTWIPSSSCGSPHAGT